MDWNASVGANCWNRQQKQGNGIELDRIPVDMHWQEGSAWGVGQLWNAAR